ncbi:cytochrome b/b6 domain-containing protein [Streptomyces sp. CB01881]|uniref:cytochrome b/b6 domain-containing protein n=1 Tax=Streptomyces sp. CB01881 TaxID=2078691 RepID=UPI000CDCBB43|nr:cytochrome b/b6 domain-containing protein [Streptomyces sp. CB01881]AUY53233.1 formate dehydrogenase [Streptomyces sp. CB01881]TYC69392.1 formate dehydrogenase [Streptomyces sp. CB01881]
MHRPSDLVLRFTRAERWVHRATAALMLTCLATAACLYVPPLAELVGRRRLVVTVHVWCGLALPAPLLSGLAFRAVRADVSRLSRFHPVDRQWLRATWARAAHRPAGKFNAGQKLYAQWTLGAMLVILGTGLLMWLTHLAPPAWRTGATFVHDWLAAAIAVVTAGHVRLALRDPEARRGMRTGLVDRGWAAREHPQWPDGNPAGAEEQRRQHASSAGTDHFPEGEEAAAV